MKGENKREFAGKCSKERPLLCECSCSMASEFLSGRARWACLFCACSINSRLEGPCVLQNNKGLDTLTMTTLNNTKPS